MKLDLFNTLKERGYFYQFTDESEVKKMLNGPQITAYVGIDPTADSLHIGHCLPLVIAKHMQDFGHKIIVVLGGATALIGDPSGKNDMRKMVSQDFVANNRAGIELAISKFIKLDGDNPAIILNNADWYKGYDYIDFMRDIGVHFNVNKMLSCDAYKKRIENGGLTFFEMGYMLMQAYDFIYLNKNYGCTLEFGGSDQWTNILAGAELGRKLANDCKQDKDNFQAFTNTLLLNADGTKMGKSEKGAVWVDSNKFTPLDFYQYFYNIDDKDTEKLLKLFTFVPIDEINKIMEMDIVSAKQRMAYEVTKMVHGENIALSTMQIAKNMFNNINFDDAPKYKINDLDESIVNILINTKMVLSKSDAKRMIEQGAVSIDGEVLKDINLTIKQFLVKKEFVILKKGKKNIIKIEK